MPKKAFLCVALIGQIYKYVSNGKQGHEIAWKRHLSPKNKINVNVYILSKKAGLFCLG